MRRRGEVELSGAARFGEGERGERESQRRGNGHGASRGFSRREEMARGAAAWPRRHGYARMPSTELLVVVEEDDKACWAGWAGGKQVGPVACRVGLGFLF